jgi:hypothetical protein
MREYCFFQRSYKNAKIISTDFFAFQRGKWENP